MNVMPLVVYKKINGQPKPTTWEVSQLDRTNVKVVGEMENVLIRLFTNEKMCQYLILWWQTYLMVMNLFLTETGPLG